MERLSRQDAIEQIVEALQAIEPTADPYEVLEAAKLCFGLRDAPPDGGF